MSDVDETDFLDRFRADCPPSAAAAIVDLVIEQTYKAGMDTAREFPSGGAAAYQGNLRKQLIEDRMRTSLYAFGFTPVTLRFDGEPLEEDDRRPNIMYLERGQSRFVVARVSPYKPLGSISMIRRLLSASTFIPRPLFPWLGAEGGVDKRTLFVIRYRLDETDADRRFINGMDVVVPTQTARSVFAYVVDLADYVAEAPVESAPPKPSLHIARKRQEAGQSVAEDVVGDEVKN